MSKTNYARTKLLRIDDTERAALTRAIMAEITAVSHALNAAGGGTQDDIRHLRTLRALLERLTQLGL